MKLFHQTMGQGTDVVLIHGWGIHSEIWLTDHNSIANQLAKYFRVTMVDLPGHGHSMKGDESFTYTTAVAAIAELLPPQAVVIGWSLGGLLALQLAIERPAQIQRLILLSSSARFTQADDWSAALKETTLNQFATALKDQHQQTIQRFLALQVRGSDNERQQLRLLKLALEKRPSASIRALDSGLTILKDIDKRADLPAIRQPCLLIQGEHDRIVPPISGPRIAKQLAHGHCVTIPRASHAPFLSHPDQTLKHLLSFMHE